MKYNFSEPNDNWQTKWNSLEQKCYTCTLTWIMKPLVIAVLFTEKWYSKNDILNTHYWWCSGNGINCIRVERVLMENFRKTVVNFITFKMNSHQNDTFFQPNCHCIHSFQVLSKKTFTQIVPESYRATIDYISLMIRQFRYKIRKIVGICSIAIILKWHSQKFCHSPSPTATIFIYISTVCSSSLLLPFVAVFALHSAFSALLPRRNLHPIQ